MLTVIENQIEIEKEYKSGKRHFRGVQLPKAELRGMNLNFADFTEANLAGVDLRESILEKASFQGANLQNAFLSRGQFRRANFEQAILKGAHLTQAMFKDAKLSKADLERSHLNQADLTRANLNQANLKGAFLVGACLNKAQLREANLSDAWLAGADLEEADLRGALYNAQTQFDEDFDPTQAGMILEVSITIEELIPSFNYIYNLGCKYLGKTLTSKYWASSCPQESWLKQFSFKSGSEVIFTGNPSFVVNHLQLEEYQLWMKTFINSCSVIVRDFSLYLKKQADGQTDKLLG